MSDDVLHLSIQDLIPGAPLPMYSVPSAVGSNLINTSTKNSVLNSVTLLPYASIDNSSVFIKRIYWNSMQTGITFLLIKLPYLNAVLSRSCNLLSGEYSIKKHE